MPTSSWWRHWFSHTSRRTNDRRRGPRYRPTVEVLEGRSLPSVVLQVVGGSPQSEAVGEPYAQPLQVEALDTTGNTVVSGVVVTFAAPAAGAGCTFATSATVTTNVDGIASVSIDANTTPGAFAVTAGAAGVTGGARFSLTNLAGPAAHITDSAGSSQSAAVGATFATALQAQVTDRFGNPVPGVAVTFTPPLIGPGGSFAGNTTVTTNASGLATAPAFTANTVAGAFQVTATASGPNSPAFFNLTNLAGTPGVVAVVAGTPQSVPVGNAFATPLQVRVTDGFGNPVGGVGVAFTAPLAGPSGTFAGGLTTTTDASGLATAPAFTANTVAGTFTVAATASGVSTPADFSLTNLAGAAAAVTPVAGTPQSTGAGTGFATPLEVRVTDGFGNPVGGASVTFAVPAGGTFTGNTTVTTTANGLATAPPLTAGGVLGGFTVTASVRGATAASFSLTVTPGSPASITAVAGTPQSAAVGTAYAVPLQVHVTDAFGNPVPGAAVTFAAPAAGPGGSFAGRATVLTDASGQATAPPLTANGVNGSFVVAATVPGAGTAAGFYLTNTASSVPSSTVLTVTPIAGKMVLLTASAGAASGTPTGSVQFVDVFRGRRRVLGAAPLTFGEAALPVALPAGWHRVTAVYSGDTTFAGSSSAPVAVKAGARRHHPPHHHRHGARGR
jgi:hypothetical protein